MDNERTGNSCKYIYTAFLSMLFAMIIILGIQYGFTILTVLSFLSLVLYIVCLVYVAKNKSYAYLLTAGMLNALTSFFAEMLNVVLVRQLGTSDSYVWIIAVSELSIIGISLFPGKYLYTHKIAKQKIQKYDWWKGCLTILICSIVVRCLFQKISPLISDDHKLIYSIIIIMIVGIIFQIVNWMMVFRFVAEKTKGKS